MRKNLLLFLAAAIMLPVFTSCDKKSNEDSDEDLLFTDIPEGNYRATGTPAILEEPGPPAWNGLLVPVTDSQDGSKYYAITYWGNKDQRVYVDYVNGELYIDNENSVYHNEAEGYAAFFEASYISGNKIYFLDEYQPSYSKGKKTLDFSGKYDGNQVMVGVIGYDTTTWIAGGGIGDSYENCKLVITPGSVAYTADGAPEVMTRGTVSFSGDPVSLEGLEYGGRVKFDPSKFVR